MHGGKSTGPKTAAGKKRSSQQQHGIYAAAIEPGELKAVAEGAPNLSDELTVARVQLRRALIAWQDAGDIAALPADERTVTTGAEGVTETLKQRRPDLWDKIDRLLGRIGRLEEQRARIEQLSSEGETSAEEIAADVGRFIQAAGSISGGPAGESAFEPDPDGERALADNTRGTGEQR